MLRIRGIAAPGWLHPAAGGREIKSELVSVFPRGRGCPLAIFSLSNLGGFPRKNHPRSDLRQTVSPHKPQSINP